MTDASIYNRLDAIREAAQLLAQRFPMIGDVLMQATETFWSAIHNENISERSEEVRTHITELAAELAGDGDMLEKLEDVQSFEANALISRILDLKEEIDSSCSSGVA